MKKHTVFLSMLAVLCLFLGLWGGTGRADDAVTEGYCGGDGDGTNLTWTLEDGTLTIRGSGSMADYGYQGHLWSGHNAPWDGQQESIRNLVLEGSITSIGDIAFYRCNALTSVTIPDSVKSVGTGAFSGCSSLRTVTISEGVEILGTRTFGGCVNLRSITIPSTVSEILGNPFGNCFSLSELSVDVANHDFVTVDGVLFDIAKSRLIGYPTGKSASRYTIPDGVTRIEAEAFSGCSGLVDVIIPNGVAVIGEEAFFGCRSLVTLSLPDTVEEIGSLAFSGCSGLIAFSIPEGITKLSMETFYMCSNLSTLAIPVSITYISSHATGRCTALTDIYYGGTQEQWEAIAKEESGNDALFSATLHPSTYPMPAVPVTGVNLNLDVMTLPLDRTQVLTAVLTPANATNRSVAWSSSDPTVVSVSENGSISANNIGTATITVTAVDGGYSASCTVYVIEAVEAFGTCGGEEGGLNLTWTLDRGTLTIRGSGSMASMRSGAPWHEQRENIRSVIIEDGVTNIGSDAFNECSALTSVSIPESVTDIGGYAFNRCSTLTSVSIPERVTSIGTCAFQSCRSLRSVTIPGSVSKIETGTFNGCSALTSLTISEGVVSLEYTAFAQCHNLKSVCIPGTVSEITGNPFGYCNNLTEILVDPTNVNFVAVDGVLFNAAKDRLIGYPAGKSDISYSIPAGVVSVGRMAFYGCRNLTSVTFPNSMTEISWYGFASCGLTSAIIPEGVTVIGNVFSSCVALAVIALPETITQIGSDAFSRCNALTDVYYGGTQEQWKAIAKEESGNDALFSATLHPSTYPIPDIPLTGVALDTTVLNLTVGQAHTLTVQLIPASATDKSVTWTSSDAAVAEVNGGTVTAKAPGTATITATAAGGHTASCVVTVEAVAVSIVVQPGEGDTLTYEVQNAPEGAVLMYAVYTEQGKLEKVDFPSGRNGTVADTPVCKLFLLDGSSWRPLAVWSKRNAS